MPKSSKSAWRITGIRGTALLAAVLTVSGCNLVRYVPDDKYLLSYNKIETEDEGLSKKQLSEYIRQQPNKKIFGFMRFHLGVYNLSNPAREKGISNWLRTIGEEPVIYNPAARERSVAQLQQYLKNSGYHFARVSDTVEFNGKKAGVTYKVRFGPPYTIDRIRLTDPNLITDSGIRRLVAVDSASSLLKPGMRFDQEVFRVERNRLAKVLRDNGYYGFSREYVYFSTDTLTGNLKAHVSLGIKNPKDAGTDPSLPAFHPRYQIGAVSIITDFNTAEYLKDPGSYLSASDTLKYKGTNLVYKNRLYMRPSLLQSSVAFSSDSLFRQALVDKTIENFTSLRNFKQIKVNFTPGPFIKDSTQRLDCQILLTPVTRQSYDLSLEGTYSSGNIGFAGNLIYKHRNLLHGAENFELKFKGAMEFLADAVEDFNRMVEFGVDARLDVPRTWIPFTSNRVSKYGKPHSSFNSSFNYQARPDFTRTIANASYGYNWKTPVIRHQVNFLELNYVNVTQMSDKFYEIIKGTYIENSFRSHVVPAFNYTFTYSDQELSKDRSFFYIRVRPEIAGNLFYAASLASGIEAPEGGYRFFGTPYSQYMEADIDLRYHWVLNPGNRMAFRFFAGAGYPYGNSEAMPFEKKYFSGGSSGIRAWQVRSLGPGSYVIPEDQLRLYPNQLGDVKLEASIEYRFDLFKALKGALFLDAGNIWAIRDSDERPGAVFNVNSFYREIAIGTGFGIRADLSYFIGRLDLGVKLRDPGTPDGPKWLPGYRPYGWKDFVLNFGIGYPF